MDGSLVTEFRENGCTRLPGLLSPEQLAECRRIFDETATNPARKFAAVGHPDGNPYNLISGHRFSPKAYQEFLEAMPVFAEACLGLWPGSRNVWFLDHEVFYKKADMMARPDTPFHQDTAVVPFHGDHIAVFWIPFEPLPAESCLTMVKGSHRGPMYDASKINSVPSQGQDSFDAEDAQKTAVVERPYMPEYTWPERPGDRQKLGWEWCAWDTTPGDVIAFHPGTIHGGAPVGPKCPERTTLVLRFFGDDCLFRPLGQYSQAKRYANAKNGDLYATCGSWLRLAGDGVPGEKPLPGGAAGPSSPQARL